MHLQLYEANPLNSPTSIAASIDLNPKPKLPNPELETLNPAKHRSRARRPSQGEGRGARTSKAWGIPRVDDINPA